MAIESLATESFLSSKFMAVAGSLVIGACLTFSPSPYDTARGDSTASARSHVSNTASKGIASPAGIQMFPRGQPRDRSR